ncbi:hypothetical protein BFW38_01395 [Terasakiispira papahanaumokuakeensis]|uniref:Uncharacterized protein n=1 Tax=Terasakiispira papahanaumokuakeensis TaxID=197479 RepID=A0A1E2V6C6_9GAMM|nr:hypothetical protein [Terasakiispira papahanaumokuakeensis]ODC02396.1 hypothetical protein BFW38_01395 [Terasakiispira papahanaumokuakeensis]
MKESTLGVVVPVNHANAVGILADGTPIQPPEFHSGWHGNESCHDGTAMRTLSHDLRSLPLQ